MKHLLKCSKCGTYTLKTACPSCQGETISPRPPKFSLEDKYRQYRREEKKRILREKGLL